MRGYDVVLGKLLATSCRCVFALLAIFPILACTQLLGGVEAGQFWRTILALLHTLFFSLTVGIFVSSISRHPQKALAGTLALLLISMGGGAALDASLAFANDNSFRPIFSLASPITVFLNADGGFGPFWRALVISQIAGWVLLAAACLLIPRTWQERAARSGLVNSPWRSWWRFGSARRRAYLRSVVLDLNPLMWLGCRERWQSLWLWLVALLLVGWFIATSLIDLPFWNLAGWWMVNALATLFLYLWTASQASQVFAELRRAGMMELLLAVPLDFRKLATGAWWGLVRLFGIPIGIIVLVQFLAVVTSIGGATSGGMVRLGGSGLVSEWVMLWFGAGVGLLLSLANIIALTWFGLWMGLVSRNSLMATLKTVVFVQIIPWLVITFATAMIFPILIAVGTFSGGAGGTGWLEWFPLVSTVLVAVLTLGKDLLFWIMARKRLSENFRVTATQAIIPVVYRPFIPPSQKPMNLPPIPPTRFQA